MVFSNLFLWQDMADTDGEKPEMEEFNPDDSIE